MKDGIKALVDNFILGNEGEDQADDFYCREGDFPAQAALTEFGELSTPEVMGFIESTTNLPLLNQASWIIFRIKGQEAGVEFLNQAIANQADSKKKENLKAALSSEYFTDPKYQASGPQKKVKTTPVPESQNSVTNKPVEK